ncbi:hypothetical protein [Cohnella panacarvi]|uniref:hypothetical protein n=1 Tax=Cohnella panacarvi TaxID=400776 RepID=UPI00047DB7ED|nr:hypothetical protein [Cohnella panacarvi]
MGGKAMLLDPKLLERLFQESRNFERLAGECMNAIHIQLSKLNDLALIRSLPGERGEQARSAIVGVTEAVEMLKQDLDETKHFVDRKLAGAAGGYGPTPATGPGSQPAALAGFALRQTDLTSLRK